MHAWVGSGSSLWCSRQAEPMGVLKRHVATAVPVALWPAREPRVVTRTFRLQVVLLTRGW